MERELKLWLFETVTLRLMRADAVRASEVNQACVRTIARKLIAEIDVELTARGEH